MKTKTTLAALAALAAMAACAEPARDAIQNLLNARAGDSPRRYEEAAALVAADARAGRPLHQFVLALVSREPGAPPSAKSLPEETRKRYLVDNRMRIRALARQKDNPLAWYLLSLDGDDKRLLKRAAEGDNVQALNDLGSRNLADALKKGGADEQSRANMRTCFGYFSRAAGKDDPNGLYNLGVCYLNGWGCRKDLALAADNLKRAAEREQPKAINLLGELYRDGVLSEKDPVAAVKYFSQCAALGNSRGQYNYAKALISGDGIERNEKRGAALMESAAMQGLVEAMDEYAQCLFDGIGADPDAEEGTPPPEKREHEAAAWWYHCATKRSYPPSMDKLAGCYLAGRGVEKNERTAVAWYTKAVEYDYVPAMLHLAECCENGVGGLAKNHYNANWWKTRAAAVEGDRNAAVWLATHSLEK